LHHTLNGPINRNYASTFPWVDWIFGTQYLPIDAWPEAYGIEAEMPDSLVEQLAFPLFPQPSVPATPAAGVGGTAHPSQESGAIASDVAIERQVAVQRPESGLVEARTG